MSEQELKIRISTRYNRICIHRKTMKAIGDPTYIHLGYRSDTKELMVLGTWVDDRKSIRVRYTASGSFYINSKGLIEGIRSVSSILTEDGSYVVAGSSVKIFGETWKPAETANDMTKGEDGNYSITYKNVEPEDDVQFKVVENHSWDNPAYGKGSGNFTFNVKTACDVTITFNPETKEITVTGEGVEIPEGIKIESMYMTGNVVNVFGEDWHPNAVELKKIEENVYQVVLEDIDADDYQVKFCVNGAWTHNFGDAKGSEGIDLSEEATLALTYNGDNIKFTVNEEGSKLTVTFDCTKMDENGSGAVATFKLEAPVVPVVE